MMVNKKRDKRLKRLIFILLLVLLGSVISLYASKVNKGKIKMADNNFGIQDALARCEKGDENELKRLFSDLNNDAYLMSLDTADVYKDQMALSNLGKVLRCLAEKAESELVGDQFCILAKSSLYAREDINGALRRVELIQASGYIAFSTMGLLGFLENEIIKGDYYEGMASRALGRIGTQESLLVLWKNIFDPNTTVIQEFEQPIVWENYTYELGESRDKLPVLSFLLNRLYLTKSKRAAVKCITAEKIIEVDSEPMFNILLAPLNNKTENGIDLAKAISVWMINHGEDLKEYEDFTAISKRVTDLLGLKESESSSGKAGDVSAWVIDQFGRALKAESDSDRKKQIQAALIDLK